MKYTVGRITQLSEKTGKHIVDLPDLRTSLAITARQADEEIESLRVQLKSQERIIEAARELIDHEHSCQWGIKYDKFKQAIQGANK